MVAVDVLGEVEERTVPSAPRAATTETSRSNGTKASRIEGAAPTARQAASRSVALADRRLALAVIAEAAGLEHRRAADGADAGVEVALERRPRRKAAVATPSAAHEALLGQPVLGGGQRARRRAAPAAARASSAAAAAGTFSNS